MPILRRLIVLAFALLLAAPAAAHGKRIALVIGNVAYAPAVGPLANPGRDAALVADALRARGFAVTVVTDAGRVALQQAVDRHARALASAGPGAVGFFYYSGHGVANPDNGRNYVVPVDAVSAGDDRLWYESVPLQDLIGAITRVAGEATNIVVFDACRESLALPKGKGLGGGAKGLERVTGVPSTLIAFSTSPGALAADRDAAAATGPYATELAGLLRTSSDDLSTLFENVKFAVFKRTGRKQLPWVENGLVERVFLGGATAPPPQSTAAAGGVVQRWTAFDPNLHLKSVDVAVTQTGGIASVTVSGLLPAPAVGAPALAPGRYVEFWGARIVDGKWEDTASLKRKNAVTVTRGQRFTTRFEVPAKALWTAGNLRLCVDSGEAGCYPSPNLKKPAATP